MVWRAARRRRHQVPSSTNAIVPPSSMTLADDTFGSLSETGIVGAASFCAGLLSVAVSRKLVCTGITPGSGSLNVCGTARAYVVPGCREANSVPLFEFNMLAGHPATNVKFSDTIVTSGTSLRRCWHRQAVPPAFTTAERRRLDDALDQPAAAAQNHLLRGDVGRIGRDIDMAQSDQRRLRPSAAVAIPRPRCVATIL